MKIIVMKISLFNANDSEEDLLLDRLTADLENELGERHEVNSLRLRDLNIHYCNGCWGCWVKEPGQCVIKDDIPLVQSAFIQSDLAIFLAPMRMGFPSALMKKANDRLIPLVHPYIELVENESHHIKRYEKYPYWGLILQEEEGSDPGDIPAVAELYTRTALNIKSSVLFTCKASQPINEITHEIDHI
jgi:multimeric flavodoxin WrbA